MEEGKEERKCYFLLFGKGRKQGEWIMGVRKFLSWPTNVLSKMERKLEEGKMSRLPALFKNNMGIIVINSPCFHFFILSTKHTWQKTQIFSIFLPTKHIVIEDQDKVLTFAILTPHIDFIILDEFNELAEQKVSFFLVLS